MTGSRPGRKPPQEVVTLIRLASKAAWNSSFTLSHCLSFPPQPFLPRGKPRFGHYHSPLYGLPERHRGLASLPQ